MKPLLSICMPTYNRCEYLKKSIDSIVCQKEFIDKQIEVVISDNASTDNTETLCSFYAKKFDNFKYFKNSENVMDRNFPLALSRANGVFRKLSNDTLIYYNESLSNLCDFIGAHIEDKPPIFMLNRMIKSISDNVIVCDSFNSFVLTSSYWCTWLAAFGIWEKDCEGIEDDIGGCELKLWQASKFLSLVSKDNNAIIYNIPITLTQEIYGKDISYGIYNVFYINFLSILREYNKSQLLSSDVFDIIRKDLLYCFFTDFIITQETNRRKLNFSSQEDLKQLVFDEYKTESYWSDYIMFYKKHKKIFIIRQMLKSVLKKLHIWNTIVTLRIKNG